MKSEYECNNMIMETDWTTIVISVLALSVFIIPIVYDQWKNRQN